MASTEIATVPKSMNALREKFLNMSGRLKRLNEIAIHQMRVLSSGGGRNLLQ